MRNAAAMVASTIVASTSANWAPTQTRGPMPKGR
jgi:hypothetical protein